MRSGEKDFHVISPTGAILAKFWPGAYKPAYSPLTHFLIAARSADALILVAPQDGTFWTLPGGSLADKAALLDEAASRFQEQTGLEMLSPSVLGYFRILLADCVEYGALVASRCGDIKPPTADVPAQLKSWDGASLLEGLDPIAAALADVAAASPFWRTAR